MLGSKKFPLSTFSSVSDMNPRENNPEWAIPKGYDATDYSIGRYSDGKWFAHEDNDRDDVNESTPFDTFQEALDYLNRATNRM